MKKSSIFSPVKAHFFKNPLHILKIFTKFTVNIENQPESGQGRQKPRATATNTNAPGLQQHQELPPAPRPCPLTCEGFISAPASKERVAAQPRLLLVLAQYDIKPQMFYFVCLSVKLFSLKDQPVIPPGMKSFCFKEPSFLKQNKPKGSPIDLY